MKRSVQFLICLIICYSPAFIGIAFSDTPYNQWYASLNKPSFMPPGWLFGPVWTLLYGMMAVSLYLVWKRGLSQPKVKTAVIVFLIQLMFNALWSPCFFGLQMPGLALIVIIVLWLFIVLTIFAMKKVSSIAVWLMIPYLTWVTFATLLNSAIFYLN